MKPKPIAVQAGGAIILVRYPYRKSPDLYVSIKGHPVFCAQCSTQFPYAELVNHIHSHDRRKQRAKLWTMKDGQLFEITGFSEKEGEVDQQK